MSFIGIAINIWRDTLGTGGGGFTPPVASFLLLEDNTHLLLEDGSDILLQ